MSPVLSYTVRSGRGLIRRDSEDSTYAGSRLLALADGMGGHAAGEITSQLIIATVSRLDNDQSGPNLLGSLRSTCIEDSNSITDEIGQDPSIQGMDTTLTALLFDDTRPSMCHVGDPRSYLLHDRELIRITRSDTHAQPLMDESNLTEEEAAIHSQRLLILKALTNRPVESTLPYRDVHEDDHHLLCSDGLPDPVSADAIKDVLSEGTPDKAVTKLTDYASKSDGLDNITVVVADVVDSSVRTPYEPALADALRSTEERLPRPNAAAGRAVVLRPQKSQEIAVTSALGKKVSRGKWLVVSVVLVLVADSVGFGIWGWQKEESMYRLVVIDGQVQLMHDVPGSSLGSDLQEPYQSICSANDNEVQPPPAGTPKDKVDCHIMTSEDLSPTTRNSLEGLPADSYDGASDQINRLAKSTLPICLSVSDDDEDATSADKKDEKLGSKPGVNCRQVRK